MIKKARKRLGKSGIRTHDPKFSEIYLIKIQFTMLFFSKGRGGAGSSSIPRGTLEYLYLGVKSPSLRIFAKMSYRGLKISKFSKNTLQIQKGLGLTRTWVQESLAAIAQRLNYIGHVGLLNGEVVSL